MNFIKNIGLRTYYQIRRFGKALKNWRRFGIIIFGGMFLAVTAFGTFQRTSNENADAATGGYTLQLRDNVTNTVYAGKAKSMNIGETYNYVMPVLMKNGVTDTDWTTPDFTMTQDWVSSNPTAISVKRVGPALGQVKALANGTARLSISYTSPTYGTVSDYVDINVGNVNTQTLTYLYTNPTEVSVAQNGTYQFSYRAEDQNHQAMNVSAVWSMNNSTAGSINSNGLFTASSTIGTYNNAIKLTSGSLTTYAKVTIYKGTTPPPTPKYSLEIRDNFTNTVFPGKALSLKTGQVYNYLLPVLMKDGQTNNDWTGSKFTMSQSWTSSNPNVVSVERIVASGKLTAKSTGTAKISVSFNSPLYGTITDYVNVTVSGVTPPTPVLTYLYTNPTEVSVAQNGTYQFSYRAEDQNHQAMNVSAVWSMNNSTAGSINSNGLFTASSTIGTYNNAIKLTSGSLTTYAKVTVYQNGSVIVLDHVTLDNHTATVNANGSFDFNVQAYTANNTAINGANYSWSVISGGGSINQNGLFTAPSYSGTSVIQVQATYGGISKYDTATITVNAVNQNVTLDHVNLNNHNVDMNPNQSYNFSATPYDTNGSVISSGVNYYWSIISGNGSINQSGLYTAPSYTGAAVIQVEAVYNGVHKYNTASVNITNGGGGGGGGGTSNGLLDYVRITPQTGYSNGSQQIDFNAQAYDNNGYLVSANYYWTVTNDNYGFIDQNGWFTPRNGVANGTYTDLIKVRATNSYGWERYDYADVVIGTGNNNNNYYINATLNAVDDNGGDLYEGDTVTYTLRLTNNRTTSLSYVRATFDIPTYATFATGTTGNGVVNVSGRTVTWDAGNLNIGETKSVQIRVTINSNVPRNAVLKGKAWVTATELNGGFWAYANDLAIRGTGASVNTEPLTPTGAMEWVLALVTSLLAAVLTTQIMRSRKLLRGELAF